MAVFGPHEYAIDGNAAYPRFADMVLRYGREHERATAGCPVSGGQVSGGQVCQAVESWSGFIASLAALDPRAQLAAVNAHFNRYDYIEDPQNWRAYDYWETPYEFLARGGDCEGFAVVKYFTLRGLGFAVADMRIVVVMDHQRGIQHAVLAVNLDGQVLILDNLDDEVMAAAEIGHYSPLMSINEQGLWVPI